MAANKAWQLPDGKILLMGQDYSSGSGDLSVIRINQDGSPDTSFGTDTGVTLVPLSSGRDENGYGVSLQADGKILLVGDMENDSNKDIVVARLNYDGSLDTTFGVDGAFQVPDLVQNDETGYAVLALPDGKILIAGGTGTSGGLRDNIALVRLLGDSVLNFAPTGVSLTGTTTSLAEDADTTLATTVATIVITDDGEGTNTITLTGTDATSFEVVDDALQLVAGTALDYETKDTYSVTVNVEDSGAIGGTPVTVDYTLTITDVASTVSIATTQRGSEADNSDTIFHTHPRRRSNRRAFGQHDPPGHSDCRCRLHRPGWALAQTTRWQSPLHRQVLRPRSICRP